MYLCESESFVDEQSLWQNFKLECFSEHVSLGKKFKKKVQDNSSVCFVK